jgi:hypothetical protein
MGIEFADDEPLDINKILERDRKRFELDEASKSKGGSI